MLSKLNEDDDQMVPKLYLTGEICGILRMRGNMSARPTLNLRNTLGPEIREEFGILAARRIPWFAMDLQWFNIRVLYTLR